MPTSRQYSGALKTTGFAAGLTLYAALAAATAIIFPVAAPVFLVPIAIVIVVAAPQGRAVPQRLSLSLVMLAAFLLPVWPIYLHVKIGPLPIITPTRLVMYALTALWAYDMTFSPLRRGQFVYAVRRSRWISAAVFALFGLGLLSLPMAEGRSVSIPEFFRHVIIWLLPYCAVLTYVRRQRDMVAALKVFAIGGSIVAAVALAEAASGRLFANLVSPFIDNSAEWLRNTQAQKIRDGVFRAQASHTHPLSLGEHLALTAPLALSFALAARRFSMRALWGAALVVIVLGAIATNSRGAMLATAISLCLAAAIVAWRTLRRTSASKYRPLAGLVILCCIAASPVVAVGAYGVVTGKGGEGVANSTQSRVDQMEMAAPKIMKRPIGGYGVGRAARVLGYWGRMLTIDNYYLSLALDLGIPGPLTFLAMMAAMAMTSLRRSRAAHPTLAVIYVGCFASACVIAISRSITSQTGNIAMIFFLLAVVAGASVTFSRRRGRNAV